MKTAISVPDALFKKVEEAAKKMGISRSKLFSIAIYEFLHHHYHENVTQRLNEIYRKSEGSIEEGIEEIQAHSIPGEDW
mgnify:CR=1 FL=1